MADSENGLTSALSSQSPLGPRGLSESAPADIGGVSLSEHCDLELLNVRLDGNNAALLAQFKNASGLSLPTEANTWSVSRHVAACWLSPDEWFLLGARAFGRPLRENRTHVRCTFALVQARAMVVRIEGENAAMLAGCMILTRAMGKVDAQTNIAKTGALVIVRSRACDVVVRRSFADYLYLWLSDGASTAALGTPLKVWISERYARRRDRSSGWVAATSRSRWWARSARANARSHNLKSPRFAKTSGEKLSRSTASSTVIT